MLNQNNISEKTDINTESETKTLIINPDFDSLKYKFSYPIQKVEKEDVLDLSHSQSDIVEEIDSKIKSFRASIMPKGYHKIKINQGKVAFEEIKTDSYDDDEFESLSEEKSSESDIDTNKIEKEESLNQENNIDQQITKQLSFSTDDEESKISIKEEINCSENINDQLINDLLKQDSIMNFEG